jgi:site-specific DNA-adenine methylase
MGVNRKRPHLGNAGMGVNRKRPHLGNAGKGVNRQLPHLGDAGMGEPQTSKGQALLAYLQQLAERLRGVRVCCGDWSRICGPTPTVKQGITAMFLDPPYGVEDRDDCYDSHEDYEVSAKVREWALQWQDDPRMRIALCGYEGEHDMPASWECMHWKARGGFGSQSKKGNDNCKRERIWFSPHCLKELSLFSG